MPTEPYICKKGDSFIKIALGHFGDITRAGEIAELNRLQSETFLVEGQELIVPTGH